MKKEKIAVLSGGGGSEHAVSQVTGQQVAQALEAKGYAVSLHLLEGPSIPVDLQADVVFIALHGAFGEGGPAQERLEALGLPYTGSGPGASRLCMDKVACKRRAARHGVPILADFVCDLAQGIPDASQVCAAIGEHWVLKPNAEGSSVGVQMGVGPEALQKAFQVADQGCYLVEPRVYGRELSVGLLGQRVLNSVEIQPKSGFYNYQNKYTQGACTYLCPAPLPIQVQERLLNLALNAYQACGCRGFGRVDFMLPEGSQEPVLLEINTIPGLTPTSLLPRMAAAQGLSFNDLIELMVLEAMQHAPCVSTAL